MSSTPPEVPADKGRVRRRLLDGAGQPIADVTAEFRPRPGEVRIPGGTVLPRPVVARSDDDGWLRHDGVTYVDLLAPDPSHTPAAWQWEVRYSHTGVLPPAAQVFDLTPGQTLDLDTIAPTAGIPATVTVYATTPGAAGPTLTPDPDNPGYLIGA